MRYIQYVPFTVLTLICLLSGCKDDDGNISTGQSEQEQVGSSQQATTGAPTTPEVYDKGDLLLISGEQDAHTLDLARFVPDASVALAEAQMDGSYNNSQDNVCHSPSLSSGSPELDLTADGYGLCHLMLTFKQGNRSYSRSLTINYTRTPDVQVPALSEVLSVNESRTINLADDTAIKALLDQGYSLSGNLSVAGTVTATVADNDADGVNDSITISSGDVLGPNRITYLLEKAGNDPDMKTGIIDVTVSSNGIQDSH